ncbi:MAG: hypothetical protein ABMA64_09835 [Myxococcota bacterium]
MIRWCVALGLIACKPEADDVELDPAGTVDPTTPAPSGVPLLGGGTHDLSRVTLEVMLDAEAWLSEPSDLAFRPSAPNELWITNRATDSISLVTDPAGAPDTKWCHGPAANHFLAKPAGLAFAEDREFLATIHDEDQETQGEVSQGGTPADFMGPTLWTADPDVFDGGDQAHADMLHNSPAGRGIAWEYDHVYWVFDGYHDAIARYDFTQPHELGGVDHSDGKITRWVEGDVRGVDGVVSHLAFDPATSLLYVADTGNSRIAILDTTSGSKGDLYGPAYDTPDQNYWDGGELITLVDGAEIGLEKPAGLELRDGLLWVTDSATATVWAFDAEDGSVVDYLPLGRQVKAVQGITFDADGDLWITDAKANEVLRLSPNDG